MADAKEDAKLLPDEGKARDFVLVETSVAQEEGCMATFFRGLAWVVCSLMMCLIPCFWCSYIKVFDQYERCVHFRLGKLQRPAKGPGMFFFVPCIDTWRTVDLRVKTIHVPSQEMMTKDSVTTHVNAVVYFHIRDAIKAVLSVQDYIRATAFLAQTTLRAVVGECELDELLQKRDHVNHKMTQILDHATDQWGVKVSSVEVKDVTLPANMQRAMGSQAEAERERRAKVIAAEGELQASRTLLAAAQQMTRNPTTLQLRYLQTLVAISQEKNNTYVFPLPLDILQLLENLNKVLAKSVAGPVGPDRV
jgi:regulator of protease activity HflC (stomatin/prohibitin superfamily)